MLNPYAVMYDARMDVYRWQEVEEGNCTKHKKMLVASKRPCRYSSSGQVSIGSPNPSIQNSHKLFCGLEEDIREGDMVEVVFTRGSKISNLTWNDASHFSWNDLRLGKLGRCISITLGECHPYTYQWQCDIKRDDNA